MELKNPIAFPLFSVIVPVYKVEQYRHQCVDSVLVQDFEDFEIILVDDGSPDNCPHICDEYAAIFVSMIKMNLRIIRDMEQRMYYFIGLAAAFVLLYQKGLFGQEGWLFTMILMPGLIISFRKIAVTKRTAILSLLVKKYSKSKCMPECVG